MLSEPKSCENLLESVRDSLLYDSLFRNFQSCPNFDCIGCFQTIVNNDEEETKDLVTHAYQPDSVHVHNLNLICLTCLRGKEVEEKQPSFLRVNGTTLKLKSRY